MNQELDLRTPPRATAENAIRFGNLRWWIQTTKALTNDPEKATEYECNWLVIMDNTQTKERTQATGRNIATLVNICSRKLGEPIDPDDYQFQSFKTQE